MNVQGFGRNVVTFFMLRVLGGNTDDAFADMALQAGDASPRNQGGRANGDGAGPKRQGLDRIDPGFYTAHQHDGKNARLTDIFQRIDGFGDGRERRDADMFENLVAGRPGRSL